MRTSLHNHPTQLHHTTTNNFRRGYSAHEHTVLFNNTRLALPQDIIVETLIAVVIVSVGLVLGADQLKPISWRDWAGQIEQNGGARNPYLSLEERYGFWDIRVSLSLSLSLSFLRVCGFWSHFLPGGLFPEERTLD